MDILNGVFDRRVSDHKLKLRLHGHSSAMCIAIYIHYRMSLVQFFRALRTMVDQEGRYLHLID